MSVLRKLFLKNNNAYHDALSSSRQILIDQFAQFVDLGYDITSEIREHPKEEFSYYETGDKAWKIHCSIFLIKHPLHGEVLHGTCHMLPSTLTFPDTGFPIRWEVDEVVVQNISSLGRFQNKINFELRKRRVAESLDTWKGEIDYYRSLAKSAAEGKEALKANPRYAERVNETWHSPDKMWTLEEFLKAIAGEGGKQYWELSDEAGNAKEEFDEARRDTNDLSRRGI